MLLHSTISISSWILSILIISTSLTANALPTSPSFSPSPSLTTSISHHQHAVDASPVSLTDTHSAGWSDFEGGQPAGRDGLEGGGACQWAGGKNANGMWLGIQKRGLKGEEVSNEAITSDSVVHDADEPRVKGDGEGGENKPSDENSLGKMFGILVAVVAAAVICAYVVRRLGKEDS